MNIRAMRGSEREAVLDLLELAFPGERGLFATYLDEDPDLRFEDTLLAFDGDRPVSCVQVFTKRIRLRGEEVLLGGIGSVGTHPEHRKRRLATALLERADAHMRKRGMALGLLFSTLHSFYGRIGWHVVPCSELSIRRGANASPPSELRIDACEESDLPAMQRLYEAYSGSLETTTVRDARYWKAQLRFAGPEEERWIARRAGRAVAYVRTMGLYGASAVLEFGCETGEDDALAATLLARVPERGALLASAGPGRRLEEALQRAGARVRRIENRGRMWRVLDRERLLELTGANDGVDDATLLERLVGGEDAAYWTSDRF